MINIPGNDDFYKVEIDDELVELILAMNKAGLRTTHCCSGHGKTDAYVTLAFENISDVAIWNNKGEWSQKLVIWWDPRPRLKENRSEVVHSYFERRKI